MCVTTNAVSYTQEDYGWYRGEKKLTPSKITVFTDLLVCKTSHFSIELVLQTNPIVNHVMF